MSLSMTSSRIGAGGYEVPWLQIKQMHVPTTYNLALGGAAAPAAAHNSSTTTSRSLVASSSSVATSAVASVASHALTTPVTRTVRIIVVLIAAIDKSILIVDRFFICVSERIS